MTRDEDLILNGLIYNEEFCRKTLPYIEERYFESFEDKLIFRNIRNFFLKFNSPPTIEAVVVAIKRDKNLDDEMFKSVLNSLVDVRKVKHKQNVDFLIETAEKYCQERAIFLALVESMDIADGESKKPKSSIPEILSEALRVSFETDLGHDYLEHAQKRFELYEKKENKIMTGIHYLDLITKGGFSKKTLNVFLAGCVHPDTKVKVRLKPRNKNQ